MTYSDGTWDVPPSGAYVPVAQTQSAEGVIVPVFTVQPFTAGTEPFQVGMDSVPNSGGGAGTENHGMWYGWNAGRHSGQPVVAGKPAFIFGIEDNFYDPATSQYTGEFYMEYWSPDGTTVQGFRPFYASIRGTNANAAVNAAVLIGIGTSSTLAEFVIQSQQGGTNYFYIQPQGAEFTVPLAIDAAGALKIGPTTSQASITLDSATVEPIIIFQIAGAVQGYLAASGSIISILDSAGTAKVSASTTGIGFYGTAPVAKATVTGSKGANAALTSLMTALAGLGLVTDSTT